MNPLIMALQNPQGFINSMAGQVTDPRAKKAIDLYNKHDSKGLKAMAENMCKEYGTTPEAMAQQLRQMTGVY